MRRAPWAHRPATVPSAAATFTTTRRHHLSSPHPTTRQQHHHRPHPAANNNTTTRRQYHHHPPDLRMRVCWIRRRWRRRPRPPRIYLLSRPRPLDPPDGGRGRRARPTAALDIYAGGDVAGEGGRAARYPPVWNAASVLALMPLLTCPVRGEQRGEERSCERRVGDCRRLWEAE
jgi:hypothetical protein